jgi:hypothetical protein
MRALATTFAACLLIAPSAAWGQSGLMVAPNPVNFNVLLGAGVVSQNVSVTFNGSPVAITGISATTTTGQNWLQPSLSGFPGVLTVATNATLLSAGPYVGTVVVNTLVGQFSFQVNLTVIGGTPPGVPAPPSLILMLTGLAGAGLYQARRIFARARQT